MIRIAHSGRTGGANRMIRTLLNQLYDVISLMSGPTHPFATEEVTE